MDLLKVETRDQGGWRVVTAAGQLDVATAPEFRQSLVEAQYGGETHVVVDLDGIEFMDSMGLGVLVVGRHALERAIVELHALAPLCRSVQGADARPERRTGAENLPYNGRSGQPVTASGSGTTRST